MSDSYDDLKELKDACKGLSPQNLKYVIAVLNALKFTEITNTTSKSSA